MRHFHASVRDRFATAHHFLRSFWPLSGYGIAFAEFPGRMKGPPIEWPARRLKPPGFLRAARRLSLLFVLYWGASAFALDPARLVHFDKFFEGNGELTLAFGNGWFVAVRAGQVLRSKDGRAWTVLPQSTAVSVRELIFGGGLFAGVGGTNVWTSQDGSIWQRASPGVRDSLVLIAYGNGQYLALTQSGEAALSNNGSVWSVFAKRAPPYINALIFGAGRFVGLGATNIVSSVDGLDWTAIRNEVSEIETIAYGAGLFVAPGRDRKMMVSADGLNWSVRSTGIDAFFTALTYAGGRFVGVGDSGIAQVGLTAMTSLDGLLWTMLAIPGPSFLDYAFRPVDQIAYGNGVVVAGGESDLLRTTDTREWEMIAPIMAGQQFPSSTGISGIYAQDKFVILRWGGLGFTSPDALAWSVRKMSPQANPSELLWCSGLTYGKARFVAVGWRNYVRSPRTGLVALSGNGETWELLGVSPILNAVAHDGQRFVAAGEQGKILVSSEGFDWMEKNSPTTNSLNGIVSGQGQLVVVGNEGTILTSADGEHWEERDSGTTDSLLSVAAGRHLFVACGGGGTLITSTNGSTWRRSSIPQKFQFTDVTFGNDLFVAVAFETDKGRFDGALFVSQDGERWTSQLLPQAYWGGRVTYGRGRFVLASKRMHYADVTEPVLELTMDRPGALSLSISGGIDSIYQIETSLDLSPGDWIPLLMVTNHAVTTGFTDTNRGGPMRFYRARLLSH